MVKEHFIFHMNSVMSTGMSEYYLNNRLNKNINVPQKYYILYLQKYDLFTKISPLD